MQAYCMTCRRRIADVDTCAGNDAVQVLGTDWRPTKRWVPENETDRCPDCNVAPNMHHHLGCEIEICPTCDKRRVKCKCDAKRKRRF